MSDFLSIVDADDLSDQDAITKLEISEFGRISHASICTAPLTILVGKNNTGKSYMAALLWALRDFSNTVSGRRNARQIDAPLWLKSYIKSAAKTKRGRPLEITGDQVSADLNIWLSENKNAIVSNLMSAEHLTIGDIKIQFSGSMWLRPHRQLPFALRGEKFASNRTFSSWMFSWKKDLEFAGEEHLPSLIMGGRAADEEGDELYALIIQKFISRSFSAMMENPVYVPAARTGLMLALPSLVTSSIENFGLGDQKVNSVQFSIPTIRFIQSVAGERFSAQRKDHPICKFIEENILRGTVAQDDQNRAKFNYTPAGTKVVLPLHVTSSMVSELTPLLASLRRGFVENGIILEEPEAHLHLSAQRWMARAIVKLVNSDIPVVITTHSDTFIQQLNVLIQLHDHPDRERLMSKYGYSTDELLDMSKVRAYEFVPSDTGTVVTEVERSAAGLVVKSLNETLYSIAEEVFAVEAE